MPNNENDLKLRLLKLLPIKIIKDFYNIKGSFRDVSDQLVEKSTAELMGFFFENYNYTKQYIYVFDMQRRFRRTDIDDIFPKSVYDQKTVGNEIIYYCFSKTKFNVYLSDPVASESLIFYQPFTLFFSGTRMILSFTKLEKNVNNYFSEARSPRRSTVENDHESIKRELIEYFYEKLGVSIVNFNQGIKALWADDTIDSFKIQSRNEHSTRVDTMDGTLTFKERYPEQYEEIILRPVGNSQWKYLKEDDSLCSVFTTDPSKGEISITKFPDNVNQIPNVISTILTGN